MKILRLIAVFLLTAFPLFSQNPEWLNFTNGETINCIAVEGSVLWISTTGGMVKLNKDTGEKTFFNKANSGLPYNFVFLNCFYNLLSFTDTSGQRFFAVNVDFLVGSGHISDTVPMVGYRNADSVEFFLFKKFAVILVCPAIRVCILLINDGRSLRQVSRVKVAHGNQLNFFKFQESPHIADSLRTNSNRSHYKPIAWRYNPVHSHRR